MLRLASAVREARVSLGLTKEGAARLGPLSSITWKRAEDGERIHELSLAKIERVLGWEPGTAARILAEPWTPAGEGGEVAEVQQLGEGVAALMSVLDAASPVARAAALAAAQAAAAQAIAAFDGPEATHRE